MWVQQTTLPIHFNCIMGVKDFMPFVRDSGTATNTRLQDLIRKYPSKDWIGIDMSILLISAIKSSPNFIDLLFAIPHRPIDGLNDKICSSLSVYVNNGFTVACVFDGTAHQLFPSEGGEGEEEQVGIILSVQANSTEVSEMYESLRDLWKSQKC